MSHYIIKHIHGDILFNGHAFTCYDLAEDVLTGLGLDRNNYLICPLD